MSYLINLSHFFEIPYFVFELVSFTTSQNMPIGYHLYYPHICITLDGVYNSISFLWSVSLV